MQQMVLPGFLYPPIFVFVPAAGEVAQLSFNSIDEPFHGFSDLLFLGYAAHEGQLSPIYWPREHIHLADASHAVMNHIGYLATGGDKIYDIYEIRESGSTFLRNISSLFCKGNAIKREASPIWTLDMLQKIHNIPFHEATFPLGFPPPAPPLVITVEHPPQPFCLVAPTSPYPSLDDDYESTGRGVTASIYGATTVEEGDIVIPSALEDDDFAVQAPSFHPELSWIVESRLDILDSYQKQSLRVSLANSYWGKPFQLGKCLYSGHLLVGIPENPFDMHPAFSRQLITTCFIRAVLYYNTTFEALLGERLKIKNAAEIESEVGWSYLRNKGQFKDSYIDYTSDLRKVARGSASPLTGFVVSDEHRNQRILDLIILLNSDNVHWIQQAISDLVTTQAFKEVLWVALMRPLPELADVHGRMADLFPGDIQDWNGNLRCSTVCSLVILMYQAFTHGINAQPQCYLKAPQLHPRVTAACNDMYMCPEQFPLFSEAIKQLPSLREVNVFGMDTKNGVPKVTIIQGVRRVKTLTDISPIQINSALDFQVPYAQFSFPAPSHHVEMHISHFCTKP
ncbi:hypothetical protein DEU56DRAFT_758365 [Suillus clintonianus]|uniref:uncharacterized protein n=1 Tax=Suillus clintonianus TaxID=1904413 RepID=UPI001B87BDD4|nr:uncharacterized protein DEU56DRAFT_762289 [Suillus clintonianus]XP_041203333.1 uncharacterized protein DEU56DRAFT_760323 [Suillus clintonianus]XP_041205713.1 uncharacterized protein DEU56DRAFT_758365 [Suillus clintonianus]KAG2110714.1 hypothetical protein DEU56DRAFT_762289 [Suillus clintonianus]KAG2122606.1 hypothetical protein DEU56DRAFT_760323 [Suillus clintonianus]KAG2128745.1 hypothetical protein DEU56DRAFT_758365 [Suillus clintonianus]